MDNYIQIEIEAKNIDKEIDVLNDLFSSYPKEDVFYELTENGIKINLRELDFYDFKERINSLSKQANGNASKVLISIIKSVENIRSYGLNGRKRLYVGYNGERKVKNRKEKVKERGAFFYANDNNFDKSNNPVPNEFINKIINADSESILKKFPDNCIDLIFTSPPYNFGLDYQNHKDGVNWNEYFCKLFNIFRECIRILKYGGRIIVNVQPLFSDYIPIHHIISNFFINNKMIWKGEIIWEKHNYNCKYTAWGSWKNPSNPYLKYTWEFLEIFCKGDLKHEGNPENADITADEFKKWVYAKWEIPPETNMKKFGHPAMFPEALVERVLKLFSFKNDIILDPFNGVGTTTFVAKKLMRRYIGIDISEEYCKKAEERLKRVQINLTLF